MTLRMMPDKCFAIVLPGSSCLPGQSMDALCRRSNPSAPYDILLRIIAAHLKQNAVIIELTADCHHTCTGVYL